MIPIEQERWSINGRDRRWVAAVQGVGQPVVVSHNAILAPGEELSEYPETWELTWAEWEQLHEVNYGLDINGVSVTVVAERKAAWRKLRRMANGEATFDEATVRDAFGAIRRILRDLTPEVAE